MNTSELKRAAEVMARAANGEIVEEQYRNSAFQKGTSWITPSDGTGDKLEWNWSELNYRILDFPAPPKGQAWQNPHSLTATQVGVHEGWRLLLESELGPIGSYHPIKDEVELWFCSGIPTRWKQAIGPINNADRSGTTYRTKAPLPPAIPTTAEEAWNTLPFPRETCKDAFLRGWNAAVEYMNSLKDKS